MPPAAVAHDDERRRGPRRPAPALGWEAGREGGGVGGGALGHGERRKRGAFECGTEAPAAARRNVRQRRPRPPDSAAGPAAYRAGLPALRR